VRLRFSIRAKPAHVRADADPGAPSVEHVVEIPFASGEATIGRRQGATIELPFSVISGQHARLFRDAGGYRIEDLGSANGTWLGRRRLVPHLAEAVTVGETIDLAGVELRFEGELSDARPILDGEGTATLARRLVHDIFAACPPAERARLMVVAGPGEGRTLTLATSGRAFKLGRGEQCDLAIPDDDISREHAAFERDADGLVVRDLDSKNGVEVEGQRVVGARRLRDGETVRAGQTYLRVIDPEDRYLRQMAEEEDRPGPMIEAAHVPSDSPVSTPRESPEAVLSVPPGGPRPRGALPLLATAIGVAALLLALGLVLALAFVAEV
jgi:pSer/pThr/pTyr-binding forkhead associated (FHA) protein